MPISPENLKRYPPNWDSEIRPAILKRADNRCEFCQVPNHERIVRRVDNPGIWAIERLLLTAMLEEVDWSEWRAPVTVVLTIAHLDHTPETDDPELLRALCQFCHNRLDATFRARNRKTNRIRRSGQQSLFGDEEVSP